MISMNVAGKDTYKSLNLVMTVEALVPPQPKFNIVDIPGGNGQLNLTKALNGDTVYSNRTMEFLFTLANPNDDFEAKKTELSNLLNGQEYDFTLSFDPDYTYHGWFSIDSYERVGHLKQIKVIVDADPYKLKEVKTYSINANGGKVLNFQSGRKKVQPIFECSNPTIVGFGGIEFILPQGAYKCSDIWFTEGWNEIYLNSWLIRTLTWNELEALQMTWDEADKYRWFEFERYGMTEDITGRTWDELRQYRWDELSDLTWNDIEYQDAGGRVSTTIVSYEWSDL